MKTKEVYFFYILFDREVEGPSEGKRREDWSSFDDHARLHCGWAASTPLEHWHQQWLKVLTFHQLPWEEGNAMETHKFFQLPSQMTILFHCLETILKKKLKKIILTWLLLLNLSRSISCRQVLENGDHIYKFYTNKFFHLSLFHVPTPKSCVHLKKTLVGT